MGWFTKGFEDAEAQVAASGSGSFTKEFFLKSGDAAKGIRIVDEDSINIRAHFVKGKGWYTCIQGVNDEECPLCALAKDPKSGIGKAQNQFVFNVFDPREYTDRKGETHKDQIKIWRVGITLLRVLNKKRAKYGPYPTWIMEISKMGSGQSTAWDIEVEKAEGEFVAPEGQETYDLEAVLAPKSRAELLKALNASGSSIPSDDDGDDDDDKIDWKR
jgi:hypothetical protein